MKKLLLIIPVVLFFKVADAQVEGCLVPGYPDLLTYQSVPGGTYSNRDAIFPPPNCYWILRQYISGCAGHGSGGIKGIYELECPIDDYVSALFIFTAATAIFFRLKKPDTHESFDHNSCI